MTITANSARFGGTSFAIYDEHGNYMLTAETWEEAMEFIAIFEG